MPVLKALTSGVTCGASHGIKYQIVDTGGKGWLEQNQCELIFIQIRIEISIQSSFKFCNIFHLTLQPRKVQSIVTHKIDLLKVIDLYWAVYVYV